MLILSTILNRLWVASVIPPSGQDLLITWALVCGYCLITIPLGLVKTLVNFEPIEVWLNLEMYRDGLRLRGNREALKLMFLLLVWVIGEEVLLRGCLVPLAFEHPLLRDKVAWLGFAWLVAIARYLIGYRYIHPMFQQRHFLLVAALLEIGCLLTYVFTESLWLTVFFHWLIVVVWLLPLGGRYQLQRYKKLLALDYCPSQMHLKK